MPSGGPSPEVRTGASTHNPPFFGCQHGDDLPVDRFCGSCIDSAFRDGHCTELFCRNYTQDSHCSTGQFCNINFTSLSFTLCDTSIDMILTCVPLLCRPLSRNVQRHLLGRVLATGHCMGSNGAYFSRITYDAEDLGACKWKCSTAPFANHLVLVGLGYMKIW